MNDYQTKLKELLNQAIEGQASDLHLVSGYCPALRISGRLIPLTKEKKLNPDDVQGLAFSLMSEEQREKFLKEKEIDFSFDFGEKGRFRINIFYQKGSISAALRLIPKKIKTIEELSLPPILYEFCKASQGFILVTGPSGHGKSSTLAALINEINHIRTDHIITIEDPIEYIFEGEKAIIEQREVGSDTMSFAKALRSTFRQDPNVIMVGEMRDPETMATAISAAETGHLVFSTLHTNNASQTIHRIIDSVPAEQQTQIRIQLASSLLGVISQRLIPRTKGGLIPACEVMIANSAIANLIRENKTHEINLVIETSAEEGMISLNRSLADLVKRGEISLESASIYSSNPAELKTLVKR